MLFLLVPAQEPAIEFIREQQEAQECAAPAAVELSKADVQGLLFGGGGPDRPVNDGR